MKRPSWLQVEHMERTDHALVYTLRVKRNWALWKFLWQHVCAPWPLKLYVVTRAWFKF
jgi:hypothetical protein